MSRTVRYVSDQAGGLSRDLKNLFHDGFVWKRSIAPDIVNFAIAAFLQKCENGAAMIFHVKPVANLHSVAIDRKRLVVEGVRDHERNQFLGKLIRAVIVG